ncbi:hypothetical protein, conserved [Leishmania tarentolae]|uniref:Uncharacterized protein n=1 Tax=Leishmania tarentolae TaxID=5689 RepID=A0A640KH93_LEITA|nr:hypothetical protein, conserved [Leishmania tarentolae]
MKLNLTLRGVPCAAISLLCSGHLVSCTTFTEYESALSHVRVYVRSMALSIFIRLLTSCSSALLSLSPSTTYTHLPEVRNTQRLRGNMFEPLRELLLEDPQALIEDALVLGEKAGRLFGFRDLSAYVTLGGAVYPPLRCANDGVVAWGAVHDMNGSSSGSGAAGAANSASSLSADGDAALTSSSLYGHGEADTRWWPSLLTGKDAHQRSRSRRRHWLQQLCSSAPRLIPRLLHCLITAASFALPGLRSLFPSAVPGARRLLLARRSRYGGPERVTGLSFHPLYMWLAVAVEEGSADGSVRVVVYDVGEGRVMCVLTHAFQVKVSWLQWRPQSRDVLAVGCCGGVLLWRLFAGASGSAADTPPAAANAFANADAVARALFYPIRSGFTVTAGAFAHQDANILACGSVGDTRLVFLQLNESPFQPKACGTVVIPSVDGGLGQVLFDDDDLFLLCTVCDHGSLALVHIRPSLTSAPAASSAAAFQSYVVPTPAPVDCVARAKGLGPSLYFMSTARLEGVLLARVNPFIGVEVVSMISTGLHRGVGGCVSGFECSRRRLWIQTETNHLLVCRCGMRDGVVSLIPIGVAAIELAAMTSSRVYGGLSPRGGGGGRHHSLCSVISWLSSLRDTHTHTHTDRHRHSCALPHGVRSRSEPRW